MTQIKAHLMEKNTATDCSQVTVPVLAGWTKKPFGHHAIFKFFPSDHQVQALSSLLPTDLTRSTYINFCFFQESWLPLA